MKQAVNDECSLESLVRSLGTAKNIKTYAPGEAEKLSADKLSSAARRLIMRERNTRV